MNDGDFLDCACGRHFVRHSALTNHQRGCSKAKRPSAAIFTKAKEIVQARKRRRLEAQPPQTVAIEEPLLTPEVSSLAVSIELNPPSPVSMLTFYAMRHSPMVISQVDRGDDCFQLESNLDMSIAERRSKRVRKPIKHHLDIFPEPPPNLPPRQNDGVDVQTGPGLLPDPLLHETSRTYDVSSSSRNVFGLSRKYFSAVLPSHDPEELTTLNDLCRISKPISVGPLNFLDKYHPYPNKSSFLLGDWYWNGGIQKSQQAFADLIQIVGDPSFIPSDVRNTNWKAINESLGSDEQDEGNAEWTDIDAGWARTPIRISVPFNTKNGGAQIWVAGDLYHRSLVQIIKERMANHHLSQHFHMEPYQLLFNPTPRKNKEDLRVYGELYTSPAFLEAHRKLQEAPGELDCDLQRVVVALMFWSDATHLTNFGSAKLWPLYLFFGNESKYRRCKPSCNLCCHVAYFREVSHAIQCC